MQDVGRLVAIVRGEYKGLRGRVARVESHALMVRLTDKAAETAAKIHERACMEANNHGRGAIANLWCSRGGEWAITADDFAEIPCGVVVDRKDVEFLGE